MTARRLFAPWPERGLVEVCYDVVGSAPADGRSQEAHVICEDGQTGMRYVARTLDAAPSCEPGRHCLVWDMHADGIFERMDAAVFRVEVRSFRPYCTVDLVGSPGAVSLLGEAPKDGWTSADKQDRIVLRRVGSGTVRLGGVAHTTVTKPFYIGVFELTQEQYERVTGTNPSEFPGARHPVEQVSWNDLRGNSSGAYPWPAVRGVDPASFIGRLRTLTGVEFDLPTEAQWEIACRAGTASAYNNGGDDERSMDGLGRHYHNGGFEGHHVEVGSYAPNALGIYDMHGNVWEWCLDWFALKPAPSVDSPGPAEGYSRVWRGGAWNYFAKYCTSSYREDCYPWYALGSGGFRVAAPAPDETVATSASSAFALDLGVRFVAATLATGAEVPFEYSPAACGEGGDAVRILVNGETALECTEEGRWTTTFERSGVYEIVHQVLRGGSVVGELKALYIVQDNGTVAVQDYWTELPDGLFAGCTWLKSIALPLGLRSVGADTFAGCTALVDMTVPGDMKLRDIVPDAFARIRTVRIADGSTRVCEEAFLDCRGLTQVTVPASVKTLENGAFEDCRALKSICFEGDAPKVGGVWTFFFVSSDCKVYVMPGAKGWGSVPGRWNGFNTYYAVEPPPPEKPEEPKEPERPEEPEEPEEPQEPEEPRDGRFEATTANVYDGFVLDDGSNLIGLVQVKTAKQSVKTVTDRKTKAKTVTTNVTATATVTDAGGKKWSYSKGVVTSDGVVTGLKCTAKGCPVAEFGVTLGRNGMEGTWGEHAVVGSRNGMGVKGDAMMAALEGYKGKWSVTLDGEPTVRFQLNVQAKGAVKVAGNWEDGKTVSVSSQLVMDDGFACIPVKIKETKSVRGLAALLRIDGERVSLVGGGTLVAGGRTVSDLGEPEVELVTTAHAGRAYSARLKMPELAYPMKFAAKGLPAGLKIQAATGVISGTPTKPGFYVATVTVTSGADSKVKVRRLIEFTVENFTDGLIPVADAYGPYAVGASVEVAIPEADGCTASGLPSGLRWKNGVLSGTPRKAGEYTVCFKRTVKEPVNGKMKSVVHQASATFTVVKP